MAKSSVQTAPYGTWKSTISADLVSGEAIVLSSPRVSSDGKIYYLERRPTGISYIVEIADGKARDVLPEPYSARSTVHEYGGAPYSLTPGGDIIFTDGESKAVFVLDPAKKEARKLLEKKDFRYADFDVHPTESSMVAIEENHTDPAPEDVKNRLVLIDLEKGSSSCLIEGADFYTNAHFSPDGKRISWLQWNHPEMPWTGAALYVADYSSGSLENVTWVAGKAATESVTEPRWAPDGRLFFARDGSGYYQFSFLPPGSTKPEELTLKGLSQSDCGGPEWTLGTHTYAILSNSTLIAAPTKEARNDLIAVDLSSGEWKSLDLPLSEVTSDAVAALSDSSFVVIGSGPTSLKALYLVDVKPTAGMKKLKASLESDLPESIVSIPEHINFPSSGETANGFFYPPRNSEYQSPSDQLPPLIVLVHGGPTGHRSDGLSFEVQYWTTRGYAVFQLNYRGSSGYGRDYRNLLNHVWGIADADDAANCAEHLRDRIDITRVGVTGGSAGGYTTIQGLCATPMWASGVSLFGISDMHAMLTSTHKFESHYLDLLVYDDGMTEAEKEQRLRDRSAISHADLIKSPLLLLQGAEDKVVPPDQAEKLAEKVEAAGTEVKLIIFEGEGHGFRFGKNIKRTLEESEAWWRKTLVR